METGSLEIYLPSFSDISDRLLSGAIRVAARRVSVLVSSKVRRIVGRGSRRGFARLRSILPGFRDGFLGSL
jgi:hypothetical protein